MYSNLDVDELWRAIGLGRYQVFQFSVWFYGCFVTYVHVVSIVFLGFRPPYHCGDVKLEDVLPEDVTWSLNDSYIITYEKCNIHVNSNNTNNTEVTSTGCVSGYSYPVDKHTTFVTEWDLVCENTGLAELSQSLLMVGMGVGSVIFPQLADRFGRKPILVFGFVSEFGLALGLAFVQDIIAFNVLRFVLGIVSQAVNVGYIIYLEMLPMESRFYVEIIGMTVWTSAISILGLVAYSLRNSSWRYLELAIALASSHVLLLPWIVDESVRWLLANGKKDAAHKIIKKAARWNNKIYESVVQQAIEKTVNVDNKLLSKTPTDNVSESEDNGTSTLSEENKHQSTTEKEKKKNTSNKNAIESLLEDTSLSLVVADNKQSEYSDIHKYTALNILKDRRILLNSIMIWFIWTTNTLTYFGLTLTSSSLAGDRFVNFILMALVEYPGIILEVLLLNRIGRRKLLMMLHFSCAIALLMTTVFSAYKDDVHGFDMASRITTLIGKMGISSSFSVAWLYTHEIYPTNMRSVGFGTAMLVGRIGGISAPFVGVLVEVVPWGPGVIFAAMGFIATLFAWFLPETLGHELPTTIEELKLWHRGTLRRKVPKTAVEVNSQ